MSRAQVLTQYTPPVRLSIPVDRLLHARLAAASALEGLTLGEFCAGLIQAGMKGRVQLRVPKAGEGQGLELDSADSVDLSSE